MSIKSKIKIIERKKIGDSRGWFLKVINGLEDDLPTYTGEIYITNAVVGEAKGGHYHDKASEWFTLIVGECEAKFLDLETGEKMSMQLSAQQPVTIFVPKKIAHIFINNGTSEFILLAYSDQLYHPEDTIGFINF